MSVNFATKIIDKFYLIIIFLIIFLISLYLISIYQRNTKTHDSSEIIIDEFIGIYFIFLFLDYFDNINYYLFLFFSFIFFRFFDILKPFPINVVDNKMKNSFGIIFDDIISGLYSIIILIIINEII